MVKAAVELVIVDSGATDASSYNKRKSHRRPVACGHRNPLIMSVRNPALKDSSV